MAGNMREIAGGGRASAMPSTPRGNKRSERRNDAPVREGKQS